MADLPRDSMSEEAPFVYCGVDVFGSFLLKDGWKEVKRYGALYSCPSSRAIHIKVVYSLSTDSFIMSLRKFVGYRGNVRMIRSDNGWGHQQNSLVHFTRWIISRWAVF